MLSDFKGNKELIDYFFKTHKLFFCDSVPWHFFNYENGKHPRTNNLQVRLEYLFGKFGFFNWTILEFNDKSLLNDRVDHSYNHKNRRYIIQEFIRDSFNNPVHHSFKSKDISKKLSIDFNNYCTIFDNFNISTHPGHTRFFTSAFLQKNLNKCFLYVNKENYYEGFFTQPFKEITSVDELYQYWKPDEDGLDLNNLRYEFILIQPHDPDKTRNLVRNTKYHKATECTVLKLWKLYDITRVDNKKYKTANVLHTLRYIQKINENGKRICDTILEKPLTIYTNSKNDVKKYFQSIRDDLIHKTKLYVKKQLKNEFRSGTDIHTPRQEILDKFDFDVKYVSTKPDDISSLNGNLGYAIWIDADILESINREIFEFLCFVRKDVKTAATLDGKVIVTNCREIESNSKWIIHDDFLKCETHIYDDKILFITPIRHLPNFYKYVSDNFNFYEIMDPSYENVKKHINNYDILFCAPNHQSFIIDEKLLQDSKIKYILSPSTGLNHIDVKSISRISVKNDEILKDVWSTAEHALYLILSIVRKIKPTIELHDKTLGIIGYGRLGKMVEIICKNLFSRVICIDKDDDYKNLFESADIISLHIDLNRNTHELIDKSFIENFKKDIYIVNTARGEIVNEQDIKELLLNGKIKGYATDVLQTEYNTKESKFKELKNVIVTPHIAGVTIDAQEKTYKRVLEKYEQV